MKYLHFFGWFLLLLGISIILWTLFSAYCVFTDQKTIPQVFRLEEKSEPTIQGNKLNGESIGDLQNQIEEMLSQQVKEVLPTETMTKLFNLIASSMLSFIFITGGGKIAGLGIKLIKK